MRRREFIQAIAGSAALWPLGARAQQTRAARLGVLLYSTPQADLNAAAVVSGLRSLGHIEGRNIALEYRYAEGKPERLPQLAAELVELRPDAILALGADVAGHVVKATNTIPIVFISSADPVQLGYVLSLARPGRNATGVTLLLDETASKRMELLKEAAPQVSQMGFLWNPDHADNEILEAQRAARVLGIKLHVVATRGGTDLDGAFRAAREAAVDSLYVVSSRLTVLNIPRIVEFATKNRLPLAGGWGEWAKAGGLLSYGPNVQVMATTLASYVDKILKGAKPGDLPVQQPTRFELIINLKAAKALGLAISEAFLLRADELIQ